MGMNTSDANSPSAALQPVSVSGLCLLLSAAGSLDNNSLASRVLQFGHLQCTIQITHLLLPSPYELGALRIYLFAFMNEETKFR